MESNYESFVESKSKRVASTGFDAKTERMPSIAFNWQKKITARALRLGRSAIFADTGLGKTIMQLAWADQVAERGKVLILTPLAVGRQTCSEAEKYGIFGLERLTAKSPVASSSSRIIIANYEVLHKIDTRDFVGIVLDESQILKNYTGKTKTQLCDQFAKTPYKLACTATPAPNDYMEIGNHAEFLGIMPSNEMLSRWFINDLSEAGSYRLKKHAEDDYWRWVASWSICLTHPRDLGYDGPENQGYTLPPMTIHRHIVEGIVAEGELFAGTSGQSATKYHKTARQTASKRADVVAQIARKNGDRPLLVWCNTDYDADAVMAVLGNSAINVHGKLPVEKKESMLADFAEGRSKILVTKPDICGQGLNWQHCSEMAFCGLNYSWEGYYQAYRRCYRFGQKNAVNVHLITSESEIGTLMAIEGKGVKNVEMKAKMIEASAKVWHEETEAMQLTERPPRRKTEGDGWTMHHDDCVQAVAEMAENSIDFSIFSPPFSGLYIYSASKYDMGNSASDAEFAEHFRYLIRELHRVTVPGRLCAVHCKHLPMYRNRDEAAGLRDFPGDCIRGFSDAGWIFHSHITLWKCPVTEMERTKNNGLLHKTVMRDTTQVRQGMADFLLVFRKNPTESNLSNKPIVRPNGFTEWHGDPALDPRKIDVHPSKFARKSSRRATQSLVEKSDEERKKEKAINESIAIWQRYADPVWWHIDQQDVLNYQLGKDNKDEKHICPLQLGVIREAVDLWTLPGDLVLSPFAGIGSEGYVSIEMKRRFVGVELKDSYYDIACKNLENAAINARQVGLFDHLGGCFF